MSDLFRELSSNSKAGAFYKAHGVTAVEDAFELSPRKDVPLMFTKHLPAVQYGMVPYLPEAEVSL